jgi:hypothetical protein
MHLRSTLAGGLARLRPVPTALRLFSLGRMIAITDNAAHIKLPFSGRIGWFVD